MNAPAPARRDRLRAMLADLKMPGALEAVDGILSDADGGTISAAEAIEQLLNAQIVLRNNRRLQTAMRSSRLPAVKTLDQFDFALSDRRIAGPAHPPCPYPGDERRELSSQPKPKTAKIPKTACLTVNAMVDPVGPQAPPALLRSA